LKFLVEEFDFMLAEFFGDFGNSDKSNPKIPQDKNPENNPVDCKSSNEWGPKSETG